MSSRAEDFPTPVSPIRRMVYDDDAFALVFDVLMIPCWRSSTLLEIQSALMHQRARCNYLIVETLSSLSPSKVLLDGRAK